MPVQPLKVASRSGVHDALKVLDLLTSIRIKLPIDKGQQLKIWTRTVINEHVTAWIRHMDGGCRNQGITNWQASAPEQTHLVEPAGEYRLLQRKGAPA